MTTAAKGQVRTEHGTLKGMRDPNSAATGAKLVARVMANNERSTPANNPKAGVHFVLEKNDHAKTCR